MQQHTEWFVEQMGLAADEDGFPRIAGRLFGLLLLSPEPRSLDDLAAALGVSKASVSTDARRLLQHGVLVRSSRPGDRRDYYAVAPDFFERLVAYRISRWAALRALAADAQRRLPAQPPAVRDRLRYLDEVHDFFVGRVDEALAEWRARPEAGKRARTPRAHARGAARATSAGGTRAAAHPHRSR